MRCWVMAFSMVVRTCSWLTSSEKVWGRYLRAMTWYMSRDWRGGYARPRVIRGTRATPLPLLPSGPGGVCGCPLHEARSLTRDYPNMRVVAVQSFAPWRQNPLRFAKGIRDGD